MVLGLVQGLTEFLPVSSSGHLVLAERLLRVRRPGLALEVGLHLGTLVAVVWVYRADVARLGRAAAALVLRRPGAGGQDGALLVWLLLASVPTAVVGLSLRAVVDSLFGSLAAVAVAWCLTGLLLLVVGRRGPGRRTAAGLALRDALWVGLAQTIALVPGASRSGLTISAGYLAGLEASDAARVAFLLSLPAAGGAVVLHLPALWAAATGGGGWGLWLGAAAAAGSGLVAIRLCVARLRAGALGTFGSYCLTLGLLCLARAALLGDWT